MLFTKYIGKNDIANTTIESLMKDFIAEIFEIYSIPSDKVVGVTVMLPRQNENYLFKLTCTFRLDLFNYYTFYFNKDLEMVNVKLYREYLRDDSDIYIKLHNLVLETLNILSENTINDQHIQIYEQYGVDFSLINNVPLIPYYINSVIENFRLFIDVTYRFGEDIYV